MAWKNPRKTLMWSNRINNVAKILYSTLYKNPPLNLTNFKIIYDKTLETLLVHNSVFGWMWTGICLTNILAPSCKDVNLKSVARNSWSKLNGFSRHYYPTKIIENVDKMLSSWLNGFVNFAMLTETLHHGNDTMLCTTHHIFVK